MNKFCWQRVLLPFFTTLITGLMIAFVVFYLSNIFDIHKALAKEIVVEDGLTSNNSFEEAKWNNIFTLEKLVIDNRYYHARLIIRARILIISLSFLTGTILCFLGSIFILGKFSGNSELETEGQLKLKLISSSPGIILTVLGVILIITSNFSKSDLTVSDSSIFFPALNGKDLTFQRTNAIVKDSTSRTITPIDTIQQQKTDTILDDIIP